MITAQQLINYEIAEQQAQVLAEHINNHIKSLSPPQAWQKISQEILADHNNFEFHLFLYKTIYKNYPHPAPACFPSKENLNSSNIANTLKELNLKNYQEFHNWSHQHYQKFWQYTIEKLAIKFKKPYEIICKLNPTIEQPQWLVGAQLNIAESCFNAPANTTAIIAQTEAKKWIRWTYDDLNKLSNRVANGLVAAKFVPGDAIAIDMVMTAESIAIYLGIIKAGCVAISIADSFAPEEIATRLRIANAKAIFTQAFIERGGKQLPMYEKIIAANAPRAIVLDYDRSQAIKLRKEDLAWEEFLNHDTVFVAVPRNPEDPINILFSSGTTGDPKAIPWTQTTPIKCASDSYFHCDIKPNEVCAWPTNLGWMMGPWLIFATLLNEGTLALYYGAPLGRDFGEFVAQAKVNMLGVVPSIVKAWRHSHCMKNIDWTHVKLFASTGECSNTDDMLYLMSLANYRPVIEYCGGTELGGAYITSTVLSPNVPSLFTTPALGLDLFIMDEQGAATNNGEIALVPPSIGLSNTLLNRDHHKVYFEGMPKSPEKKLLRRHGDQIEKISTEYFRALGRADDTMNLGGIKTSSAEIERTLAIVSGIKETAAIAINPPGGGPSLLIIYAVLINAQEKINLAELKAAMQNEIKTHLNPLFKISDVVIIETMPRTASNKVMRRVLRDQYKK